MCRSIVLLLCIGLTHGLVVCSHADEEAGSEMKTQDSVSTKLAVNPRLEEAVSMCALNVSLKYPSG